MRVAVGQMEILPGDVDKNSQNGFELIEKAKLSGCDLILLPEVWTTGFLFKKLKELSKTTQGIIERLKELSGDITICGSYVVDDLNDDKKVYNKFFAISRGEIVFEYTKSMLFGVTGEDKYFSRGGVSQKNTFRINDTVFGVSICYELRFPEFFRRAAFDGAIVHLHPAIWPVNRLEHWKNLTKARAIENQFYLLCSNGTNKSGKWDLAGNSAIYNPWGDTIANLKQNTNITYTDIDLNIIKQSRENLPSLKDAMAYFR
jgi:omega-amidase